MGEGMSDKINPCPFCGYNATVYIDNCVWDFKTYKIVCYNNRCKIQSPHVVSECEVIKIWNNRV